MDKLFLGENGFIYFFGVVENNNDPLGNGRVQVRIVGHHNTDQNEVYTAALPWAIVMQSTDNPLVGGTGKNVTLPIGCRVFGFFLDGEIRNQPVITHTLSGETNIIPTNVLQIDSTPNMPNLNPLLGHSSDKETECVSGTVETTTTVNELVPQVTATGEILPSPPGVPTNISTSATSTISPQLTIPQSNVCYPFTGYVSDTYLARNGKHKGVDIAPLGTQTDAGADHLNGKYRGKVGFPVYAIADGTVFYIFNHSDRSSYDINGKGIRSFGNAVCIKHSIDGVIYTSIYAHLGVNQDPGQDSNLSGIMVSVGDTVVKGQQIGTCGRTHNADAVTHLHFEMRLGTGLGKGMNNHFDPAKFFPKMVAKHHTFLAWNNTTNNFAKSPKWSSSDMPMQALETPTNS